METDFDFENLFLPLRFHIKFSIIREVEKKDGE